MPFQFNNIFLKIVFFVSQIVKQQLRTASSSLDRNDVLIKIVNTSSHHLARLRNDYLRVYYLRAHRSHKTIARYLTLWSLFSIYRIVSQSVIGGQSNTNDYDGVLC